MCRLTNVRILVETRRGILYRQALNGYDILLTFSNAPSCFDSALHDSANKPPLPPCAKIKNVARFSNNSPGKLPQKLLPGTHPRTCLYAAHCERLRSLLRSRSEQAPCRGAPCSVQKKHPICLGHVPKAVRMPCSLTIETAF